MFHVAACARVVYKAITDCRFHRAVGESPRLFWRMEETTQDSGSLGLRNTADGTPSEDYGFWMKLLKYRGENSRTSQCGLRPSLPSVLGKIVCTELRGRKESTAVRCGTRVSHVSVKRLSTAAAPERPPCAHRHFSF